ncbi:LacI family DNA-binding transcriptional regulator [Clostridium felsineum]|uniref:HTH-type transcriptional regulator MalR n=1 Tax=Clostridium felsineum TaxID=36839 RepID=A0A1S8MFN6_9CLOT|nr:LacI family DNA-binding transcriptional regulator [Clostridium felsineum]MCR3759990.1 LacI family transcriptional regulator [Clostridium felsineum]URZ01500.1 HTH-type transcriptional regulator MalR [Clostridium felsineum]URZ05653.1 HTH-type transcriptional regulator MalR [Clostridium felsineum]URZ10692.1 HTH-type transcriptional regulator MalR [Clostridium felsineum]URZ17393.1 HTH-type transcriptional regulator MalR [Clostridium felsineum DSM 794]
MAATIRDVARLAKVSPSTVSRVLNDSDKISDKTKDRVRKAIKKLDYHTNAIARSLANNSTKILGLIVPNEAKCLFKNPFFVKTMRGISLCAHESEYYIMYDFGSSEEEEVSVIKKYVQSKMLDGIILLTARENDKCINFLKDLKYPFVVVGRPEDSTGVMWVDNDNFKAMYTLVDNLIRRGADSIAFIGAAKEMNMSRDRLDGYKRALAVHGREIDENIIIEQKSFNEEDGYEAMKKILEVKTPSVVVTTDDLLAFGVLKCLNDIEEKGVSVIGFNNIPLAEYQNPPLASVDINAEKLGYYAAKLLIDSVSNKGIQQNHFIIDTFLKERKSIKLQNGAV